MSKGDRKPTYEELQKENEELRNVIARLQRRIEELEKKVEELQRASRRQAAPFRRRKQQKKSSSGGARSSPGRKDGHKASWRPEPEDVDEEKVVPLNRCPHCKGPVKDVRPLEQFIEEIPPVKVRVIRLVTHTGRCPRCGRVRSTHPLQMSRAGGAAKVQLGPRVLGLAAHLKYKLGLSFRDTADLLEVFGLSISPGGLFHALRRVAMQMVGVWLSIVERIRGSPVVHGDETSWYVGRPGWWLWVFTTPAQTLYVVDESRGADVVHRTLGTDFEGVLVSDCLSSYDPIDCRKHKCYSHHLRALSDAIERLPDREVKPLRELKAVLKTAMMLKNARDVMSPELYRERAGMLEKSADRILDRTYVGGGVEKALGRFRRQREHLFTFLWEPEVPATNNLAERQLRPAVIGRKISCGNRTDWGRVVWQMLSSIAATCAQQGVSFIKLIAESTPLTAPSPTLAPASR